MPNMKKQTAVTTSPVRTFLRARWRSMSCLGILEVHVGDHRAEKQREVREREQVQAQRRAAVGAALEQHGPRDERPAEEQRRREVDAAEAAGAERQLRHGVEQQRVEQ